MYRFFRILFKPLEWIFLSLIYLYKFLISPLLPKSCKFTPTCSSYSIKAIKEFGIFRGFFIATKRIVRCNPWNKDKSFDPVPDNIKGKIKWVL